MAISNPKKALLHMAKRDLHLADDDYRALLNREAGVDSSTRLDDAGFNRVMAAFEGMGFKSQRKRMATGKLDGMATPA